MAIDANEIVKLLNDDPGVIVTIGPDRFTNGPPSGVPFPHGYILSVDDRRLVIEVVTAQSYNKVMAASGVIVAALDEQMIGVWVFKFEDNAIRRIENVWKARINFTINVYLKG